MIEQQQQQLQEELLLIQAWEKGQQGLWFWEKLGRLPFKLLDKMIPTIIHQKIGTLLDEMGNFLHSGGKYLTNEKRMFSFIENKTERSINSFEDINSLSIDEMKELSKIITEQRTSLATIQGATTGIGGIFTLAVDIPAMLGLSLKVLQDIAIIHGFNPNDKKERLFIIKCLQFSSSDIVGKQAILKELSHFEDEGRSNEMISQLQGWREVVTTYRDQFGWKKLFQMVPIAGMIFGAYNNRAAINDIAEIGSMLYRKRAIKNRLKNSEDIVQHLSD
ncbi:EcsC family protein [Litchfieldia salsa]|uniref:EcsC protein family protein n=1 Tax=Litchfieldia salsa TaxID=930152 RepID=A0A1H0VK13_9BACI|nr:EcsC family protein [Litchfieldia salsa]SDP78770.1 EcsC protein family protein [Litchfieldia salsa]